MKTKTTKPAPRLRVRTLTRFDRLSFWPKPDPRPVVWLVPEWPFVW